VTLSVFSAGRLRRHTEPALLAILFQAHRLTILVNDTQQFFALSTESSQSDSAN
jgi:hypothetical protein